MSDIKLFRILGEDVTELAATGPVHALEKQLQTFMERNLESLMRKGGSIPPPDAFQRLPCAHATVAADSSKGISESGARTV